jgi:nickel/cobalt transporter (NicO) family protein
MRSACKIFLLIIVASSALAHPLGNFSVNQYSGIDVGSGEIRILQVLDLAEIPTFQATAAMDSNADGKLSDDELAVYMNRITPEYTGRLSLFLDDRPIQFAVTNQAAQVKKGEGDLPIVNFRWELVAKLPDGYERGRIRFENGNNKDRVGWNEIVVRPAAGINVYDSTAFGSSVTDELSTFPVQTLESPLAERSAEFSFTNGLVPAGSKPLRGRDGVVSEPVQKDKFAELIKVPEITPSIALFGLLLAFGLGAMHAMSPGHGKAVVGAYLVGTKGTPKHAAFLGLTVTITHTIGVFALGLVTLFASRFILPEKLMPVLSFFSGLMVLYIGLTMFKSRLFAALGIGGHHGHDHTHEHSHGNYTHTHDGHTHTHAPPDDLSWKNLIALGVSGGILPCPSALVLMLSAINLDRVGYGLVLTVAFSFGLAATLTAVGLIFLYGGRVFDGERFKSSRIVRALPVVSALVIACLGAVICYRSL